MRRSERYVFVERFARGRSLWSTARRRRAAFERGTAASLFAHSTRGTSLTAAAIPKELERFQHGLHAAAFLFGVLVFPLVETQTAFDVERTAFGDVLRNDFALFAPCFDVNIRDLFLGLAAFGFILAVDGQAESADSGTRVRHAQLMGAREIAHEEDFVEGGHGKTARAVKRIR